MKRWHGTFAAGVALIVIALSWIIIAAAMTPEEMGYTPPCRTSGHMEVPC